MPPCMTKISRRLVILGAAGVGKSCIVSQFLYDQFIGEYKETVEEMHRGEYHFDDTDLVLDILDTSGAYSFPAMRTLAIANGDAFILVYSMDDESTFEQVKSLREQILNDRKNEHVPIVIVGNKSDLPKTKHAIKRETVESLVCIDWENGYVEASAKDNVNIVGIFKEILRQTKFQYALSPAVQRRRRSLPCLTSSRKKDLSPKRHSSVS